MKVIKNSNQPRPQIQEGKTEDKMDTEVIEIANPTQENFNSLREELLMMKQKNEDLTKELEKKNAEEKLLNPDMAVFEEVWKLIMPNPKFKLDKALRKTNETNSEEIREKIKFIANGIVNLKQLEEKVRIANNGYRRIAIEINNAMKDDETAEKILSGMDKIASFRWISSNITPIEEITKGSQFTGNKRRAFH